MALSREFIQNVICGLAAAAFLLLLLRKAAGNAERRAGILVIAVLLFTVALLLGLGTGAFAEDLLVPADVLIAVLAVVLGILIRVYDSHRTFRSVSGTLRNIGNLYVFTGLVCLLSRLTEFPVILWAIPVVLFAAGYFFLPRRKGLANVLCKGGAVLVSVGFIASMMYDIREGVTPGRRPVIMRGKILTEVVRPSLVDEMNILNERIAAAEAAQKKLAAGLDRARAESLDLEARLSAADAARREAESKLESIQRTSAEADAAVRRAAGERDEILAELERERAGRAEAERRLADLEKAREAAKESFTAIDERLTLAADNLKKVVAERDALRAELETARAGAEPAAPPEELEALRRQLAGSEAAQKRLAAEAAALRETLDRVRSALAGAE
ncbi:MAG: hypothetical protein PHN82_02455 [bacterium]|nr:hypothetical protein [bacterium]